jgi:hypothetical protein
MAPSVVLRYAVGAAARVVLEPSTPAEAAFLERYLRPFFPDEPGPDDGPGVWRLSRRALEAQELESLVRARSSAPWVPECGVAQDDDAWFAWHREVPAIPWICEILQPRERVLRVLATDRADDGHYALARAVRSLLTTLACASGSVQVHASAFCIEGRAVLVLGDKGAGKTSILIGALARGAAFLSNDRVLIAAEHGAVGARGLPHSVTVRADTGAAAVMAGTPSSYGGRQPGDPSQVRYHIADVLAATGSAVDHRAPLGLVVAARVGRTGVRATRLPATEAENLLLAARRRSISSFDPLWDAWLPHPEAAIRWPAAAGIHLEYGPHDIGPALDAIREELRGA